MEINKVFEFNIENISSLPKSISGIYVIHCVDGRSYIGQAFDLRTRLKSHYRSLLLNNHANSFLQDAWNIYKNTFNFQILDITENSNKLILCQKENAWIETYKKELKSLFNILKAPSSSYDDYSLILKDKNDQIKVAVYTSVSEVNHNYLVNKAKKENRSISQQIAYLIGKARESEQRKELEQGQVYNE